MTHYQIDIVSDTVCPWCYVGKKRLDLAIKHHQATYPTDTFTTTWHAFQLNPDAPKSIDKREYYATKFGVQRAQVMQGHLTRLGRQVGINFAFGGKTGNTRDSHRLVQLAGRRLGGIGSDDGSSSSGSSVGVGGGVGGGGGGGGGGNSGTAVQNRLVEQLFSAYFEANADITNPEVLLACAVQAGLDEAVARAWLASDEGGADVDRDLASAQKKFIGGVPNFTINGTYEIRGAEEPGAFLRVFGALKQVDMPSNGEPLDGANVC